jgi:hypothetical protein
VDLVPDGRDEVVQHVATRSKNALSTACT